MTVETKFYEDNVLMQFAPFTERIPREICRVGNGAGLSLDKVSDIIWESLDSLGDVYESNPVEPLLIYIFKEAQAFIKKQTGYELPYDFECGIPVSMENKVYISNQDGYRLTDYAITQHYYDEIQSQLKDHLTEIHKNQLCSFFLDELERIKGDFQ